MGTHEGQLPEKFNSDTALAVLERATLEQALSEFQKSARDFGVGDQELQLLDIANDTAGTIGKYFFSDSSTKYKASPVEKLSLNGFNLMNYLALGQMTGASVEARRFTVMRNYLNEFRTGSPPCRLWVLSGGLHICSARRLWASHAVLRRSPPSGIFR